MKLFTHRSLINGSNSSGSIVVINGTESITIPLEQFQEMEPTYALPLGYVQREYSPGLRHDLISVEGTLKSGQMPWDLGDKFIGKIAEYKTLVQQAIPEIFVEENNSLESIKAKKIQEFNNTCNTLINEGFTSAALGSVFHYSGSLEAQTNLLGALALAKQIEAPVPLTCTEIETGGKQPRPHTLSQVEQVFADGCAFKTSKIAKYHELKAQTLAATTKEEVINITWDGAL